MDTSVQKVINSSTQGSQQDFILCCEFLDYRLRILILRSNNFPLIGEVTTSELWNNAKDTFPQSEEEFHHETKKVLSGKVDEYKFYLENNIFKWEKDLWTRGSIKVFEETDIPALSDFMINVFTNVINIQGIVDSFNQENVNMKRNNEDLYSQLEHMINVKNELEGILLKKFILILNEKKKQIRHLVEKVKNLKRKYEPSLYDFSTDEEMSCDEQLMSLPDANIKSSHLKNELLDPKPSTSKEDHELQLERGLSTPIRRRPSILDEEFDAIINNVVNIVPPSDKRIRESPAEIINSKTVRKCLSFEEDDEEFELRLDSINEAKNNQFVLTDDEPDMFL